MRTEIVEARAVGAGDELPVDGTGVSLAVPGDAGAGVVAVGGDLRGGPGAVLIVPAEVANVFDLQAVPAEGGRAAQPAINLNYGAFINNVITFVIVAWAVFLLVKAVNVAEAKLRLGEQPPADVPPPPEDIVLLREIRDSLKKS